MTITLPTATVVQAIAALERAADCDWARDPYGSFAREVGFEAMKFRAKQAAIALAAAMKANKEGA